MTSPATLAAATLRQASELLASLTEEQLLDLVEGRGRLVFQSGETVAAAPRRRSPAKPKPAVDVAAEVAAVESLTTSQEVFDRLGDRRFTVAILKQIAAALGPRVSTSARTKEQLRRNIAEGTAGHRRRAAAMSGDAWA